MEESENVSSSIARGELDRSFSDPLALSCLLLLLLMLLLLLVVTGDINISEVDLNIRKKWIYKYYNVYIYILYYYIRYQISRTACFRKVSKREENV